jgi:hypothetical protein
VAQTDRIHPISSPAIAFSGLLRSHRAYCPCTFGANLEIDGVIAFICVVSSFLELTKKSISLWQLIKNILIFFAAIYSNKITYHKTCYFLAFPEIGKTCVIDLNKLIF